MSTEPAKHTPGPWEVLPIELDRDYIRIRGTQLGMRFKIANVIHPQYGATVGDIIRSTDAKESMANARLIAAAPELLAACRVAFDQTCQVGRPKDWEQLRAAIKKATGEAAS